MWCSTRFENELKNNSPSTLINAIGQKLLIVDGSGGTTLGMKTSEASATEVGLRST